MPYHNTVGKRVVDILYWSAGSTIINITVFKNTFLKAVLLFNYKLYDKRFCNIYIPRTISSHDKILKKASMQ